MQYKEDNKKDFDERKDYSQEVQEMIDVVKVRSSIERQEYNNRKEDIIETIEKNPSTLTNSKETLRKKLDIEKDIEKEKDIMRKEKENDSLVNKGWKNDSSKRNDSLREKIDEKLKSIERSTIYT